MSYPDGPSCSAQTETDGHFKWLTLLQEACVSSNHQEKLDLLATCVSQITSSESSVVNHLMQQESFIRVLVKTIDLAIIPGFQKEYFSYEKDDFKKYPKVTHHVLSIMHRILHILTNKKRDEANRRSSLTTQETPAENETEQIIARNLIVCLPKLILLLSAHSNFPLWSSVELQTLNSKVLDMLLLYFSCESLDELLSIDTYGQNIQVVTGSEVTLLSAVLSYCWKPLSKHTWHQNPFLCHSFDWIILQMKLPHLSDYIEQVMSVALNFLEDHQAVNKIRGICCLHQLIKNTSSEEMRWLNRADVIYEQLKNQMYLKEAAVIECLFPCLFDVLKIVESPPELDRHQYVLDTMLRNTESENLLILRKIYVCHLTVLVDQVGIYSVRHLKTLIQIVSSYLEVDDGLGEVSARPNTLKLLECIIRVGWPRIQHHVDAILKMCLNFIADVICTKPESDSSVDVRYQLTAETVRCLVLLSEVCPEVLPCVRAGLQAGMDSVGCDSHLFDVLKIQLASIDTVSAG
ncbi:hypothetical protein BsWGS_12808 [Bradybaena similaris]